MSREERVKALLQQRRQSFGLTQPNQPSQSGSQQEDAAARARPVTSSKHDRIQQLLIQRRMAQQGTSISKSTVLIYYYVFTTTPFCPFVTKPATP